MSISLIKFVVEYHYEHTNPVKLAYKGVQDCILVWMMKQSMKKKLPLLIYLLHLEELEGPPPSLKNLIYIILVYSYSAKEIYIRNAYV